MPSRHPELSTPDAFNRWLRNLPTVNAKMLVAYGLAIIVVLAVCVCLIIGAWRGTKVEMDDGTLGVVCTLLAALAGVGHLDYKAQRNSWKADPPPNDSPDEDDPVQDPASATAAPGAALAAMPTLAGHVYDPRA